MTVANMPPFSYSFIMHTILITIITGLSNPILTPIFTVGLLALFVRTFGTKYLESSIEAVFEHSKFKKQLAGTAELDYRKRQLEELYGPLYAIGSFLFEFREIYNMLPNDSDEKPEMDKVFLDKINKIEWLVANKTHLIEGDTIPEYLAQYTAAARYIYISNSLHQTLQIELPVTDFNQKTREITLKLITRLHELYSEFAITSKLSA